MKRSRYKLSGIVFMIQASVSFSLMALCVKKASQSMPSFEIVFFRSLIGTLIVLAVIARKRISLLGQERLKMSLRGICGFLALSLHFYTIANLPLGTAVMLNYMNPIFGALLAVIYLKERPSGLLIGTILLSFFGCWLLIHGEFREWNIKIFWGLLSAVFAAIAYVAIRAVKHRESPLTVIFYFTGISTLGSLFFLPFGFRWPDLSTGLLLAGVGIFSYYGQLWMTIALRRAPASLLGPFFYFSPVLSYVYGLFFFGETLALISMGGVFLIILGGSLVSYFETKVNPAK